MKLVSLGLQTNMIFSRFSGSVVDRGSYIVIQTPTNPGYHWGNYLIFDRAPTGGDLKQWVEVFHREFPYYLEPHHYLFAWEKNLPDTEGEREFLAAGFEFEPSVVLASTRLQPPTRPNDAIQIKKLTSDDQWSEVIQLQICCSDPKYLNDYHSAFKNEQFAQYRRLSESGKGFWFGAYLDGKMVADLGIFYEEGIGRYQSVETHPEYRRRGICGTLVYEAGMIMMRDFGVTRLVMEADPEYHAARVYESVGFSRGDTTYSFSWWKGKTIQ